MTVYTNSTFSASVTWPDPMETIYQTLPGYTQGLARWKREDLGLCERLFIGAVMNTPREQRSWGSVSWLGETMDVSRPTLYAIGKRTKEGLMAPPRVVEESVQAPTGSATSDGQKTIRLTPNRIKRTTLALELPGGVSERSAEICLQTAFDEGRSPAFQTGLRHEAGRRADEVLQAVDYSVLGEVVQARDEIFVGHEPILLMVEPHSLVITGLYATADRDAETWGCVLLFTQDRGVQIQGLCEDNCNVYDLSQKMAQVDAAIQKDVWHPLEDFKITIHDVEREALQKLSVTEQLEKKLGEHWAEALFTEWVKPYEQMENLLTQISALRFWHGCWWDAVELVDWRSGEIRTRAINQWLAKEALQGMRQLPHPRIQKLVKSLEKLLPEMLTFLDSIQEPLTEWQTQAAYHFQNPSSALAFQNSVARFWRLEHAVQRNGHQEFAKAACEAQQWLTLWIEDDPQLQGLAEKLLNILERTVRTSCAAETINSVLRPYLARRRECTTLENRQLFLNLFVLWFNMHKFDRGPRAGKSPYEIAGIDLGTDDWLTLLGYPPD